MYTHVFVRIESRCSDAHTHAAAHSRCSTALYLAGWIDFSFFDVTRDSACASSASRMCKRQTKAQKLATIKKKKKLRQT